jgi:DNA polymerase-3 subunit epsilon
MKPTTEALKEYKTSASEWAAQRLADESTVIVDVETTGLLSKDPETEVVQVSIINVHARPLISMLIKPAQPMGAEVIEIHKITNEQVQHQPTFPQVAKFLSFILDGKHLVAYNADFDVKLLWHLFKKYKQDLPKISGSSCCMDRYAEWCGDWNEKKDGFRWQKLPQLSGMPSHDAFADCVSTLKVMQMMAANVDTQSLSADEISLDF